MRPFVVPVNLRPVFCLLLAALLVVLAPLARAVGPTITVDPVPATSVVGGSVTFSVTAPTATSYQWNKNGTPVSSATNASLAFSSVVLSDRANYQVVATNTGGSTSSAVAALTVTVPVPTAIVSASAVLKTPRYLATDGTAWYVTGVHQNGSQGVFRFPLIGGTVTQLYTGYVSPLSIAVLGSNLVWIDPNAGPVTDTLILKAPLTGAGPVTSIYIGNAVGEPLVDGSGLVIDGTAVYAADEYAGKIFRLNADGTGFAQIPGTSRYAGSFSSERINTLAYDTGVLYLADSGRGGASDPAPKVLSIPVGGSAFTTLANSAPLVSPTGIAYLGGKIYVADPGAANTVWQIPAAGGTPVAFYAGAPFTGITGIAAYNGELYVTDSTAGAVYRLVQTPATVPAISLAPTAQNVTNGGTAIFTVTATGIPAVTYQWKFNGNPLSGQTNATLTLTNVGSAQVGSYTVDVSNGVATITSTPVALTGPVAEPTFVTQPAAFSSGTVGGTASLSVTATGTALSYQWRKFGQPISGATNSALSLPGLTLADAGLYDVVVTTSSVGFPSTASRLTVNPTASVPSVLTASTTFVPRIENMYNATVNRMWRASDGKIYISGGFSSFGGTARPGYARLNGDGGLDTGFVPAPVSYGGDAESGQVKAFAPLSDNRVLIGGRFDTVGGYPRSTLARLNLGGSVDPSFNTSYEFDGGVIYAIIVQPDGKLLVGGDFRSRNLMRLNADGSEDATFAASAFDGPVYTLALQADGKVIAGGDFNNFGIVGTSHIARLTTSGALDTAYNNTISNGPSSTVEHLVLQPDGKLLVAGWFLTFGGASHPSLVRLLDTGAVDTTFATSFGFDGPVSQLALQSDGSVLAAGDFASFDDIGAHGLVRLTSTGGRDATFNVGSGSNNGFDNRTDGVVVLTTGLVLVGAKSSAHYNSATANLTSPAVRLSPTGVLDATYAPTVRTSGIVNALVPASNGKWYVAGNFTHIDDTPRSNLARLNANGTLDTSFNPQGSGFSDSIFALAVQADNKVIVGGRFTLLDGTTVHRVARLDNAGLRDPGFDLSYDFGDDVYVLALQADGKLLVGGTRNSSSRGLARLLTDGTVDSKFLLPGSGFDAGVRALVVSPDGKLYVGGDFLNLNAVAGRSLLRLNADGSRDSSFNVGTGFNSSVRALALQPDNNLVVAGPFSVYQGNTTGNVTRLSAAGVRDAGFAATEFEDGDVSTLALQADGKILAGGSFRGYGFTTSFDVPHLARLKPDGTLDTGFRVPGLLATPYALQLSSSGGVLVAAGALGFPGQIATGLALLEAASLPVIGTQPSTQIAAAGGSATFSVGASGTNLTYQWLKDGVMIAGATASSYTLATAQLTEVASYSVVVANLFGTVTSNAALLTGSGAAPTITTQPASVAFPAGDTAALVVTATGATKYQWRRFGVPIASATASAFVLPGATLGDAGLYDVLVGNGLSLTRSTVARLSVTPTANLQNPLQPDRAFPAVFESENSAGQPSRIVAQADGSYYITGEFSSVDGTIRFGVARFGATGVLDSAFAPEVSGGSINALALQADGKLLLAGDFHRVNGVERNHLARLNIDGTLDPTFLMGSGTYDSLYAVAVQPADQKIVVGGEITTYDGATVPRRLARLNSNGTLDIAFGAQLGTGFNDTVRAVAVNATDNRIHVVGNFNQFNGSSANHVMVFESNGSPVVLTGLKSSAFDNGTVVSALLVLPDGKMILGGYFTSYGGNAVNHLVRVMADGSYDSGFATAVGANWEVDRLIRQADGQIYATGGFDGFGTHTARVVQLTTDGAYVRGHTFDGVPSDLALGTANALLVVGDFQTYSAADLNQGIVRSHFVRIDGSGTLNASQVVRWGSPSGTVLTVMPAPGGKWFVGGYFDRVGGTVIRNLARLNANGSVDPTFSTAESPLYDYVRAIAVQGDGKILVGGSFSEYGTYVSNVEVGHLVRLNSDGTRDLSFKLGEGFDSTVTSLAVQTDGRILVGGYFTELDGHSVSQRLVRLLPDGSLDSTFLAGTGFNTRVNAVAVQTDGSILVGGSFSRYNSVTSNVRGLVQLQPNGVVAKSFDVNGGDVNALLCLPNGDFLAAGGFSSVGAQTRFSIARFSAAGVLDPTFNIGSLFTDGEAIYAINTLALQPDGKIVVGGDFPDLGNVSGTQAVARLTTSGALDSAFAPSFFAEPNALALRPDGSILVAGSSLDYNTTYRNGLIVISAAPLGTLPTITTAPVAQVVVYGGAATFSVVATGSPTFQWQFNGANLPGATNATYTIPSATQSDAGAYRVVVTNAAGSVTSSAVSFDVVTRNLINFYAKALVAPGGSIASSFTIEGTQPKTVLMVGVGGARANSGISLGALADPRITLFDSSGTQLVLNNNWLSAGNLSAVSLAATQVAATPGLTSTGEGAKDAAILATLSPGTYHVKLDGADAGGGAALLQIYDADTDPRPRLVMFTLRAVVGEGAKVITTGFTIDGTLSKNVLIRTLGESLGASNGVLDDPVITLFRGGTEIDGNDDTFFGSGGTPVAFAQVGARSTSNTYDSTLVETLTPGAYTVQITPFNSSDSGTVLFELFEADAQRSATIAPVITYLAPDQAVIPSFTTYFGVVAVAKPAAAFQWRKNGTPIGGATNAVLEISNTQPSDIAAYDVVVTSGANSVTSPTRTVSLLAEFHSADSDHDHRIGLLELTRVIQLFNYRNGPTRTGEYHVLAGTEDGYTLGPGTITTYHAADSNHDGRIDVGELTRVIELYNTLNGTARTGEYHATYGTEDGFATGPFDDPFL